MPRTKNKQTTNYSECVYGKALNNNPGYEKKIKIRRDNKSDLKLCVISMEREDRTLGSQLFSLLARSLWANFFLPSLCTQRVRE